MDNSCVEACPSGWLLEALAGHPLDYLLFPRRSLRWRYCSGLWRIAVRPGFPTNFDIIRYVCACLQPQPGIADVPSLPKASEHSYTESYLSSVTVWRQVSVTKPRPPMASGRVPRRLRRPPDRVHRSCQECVFWAGQCPECAVIYWTLSPWVEKFESGHTDWRLKYKARKSES